MAPHDGLVHLKEYDIEDSNVELIGTDLDHQVKYASAATEPAWNNGVIGVEPGLFVWRIEDFQVVPVPAADIGVFYEGDSYIVLHSYRVGKKKEEGDDNDDDEGKPRLGHEVFFWLGAHTSQDEAGTAAYKTVELDEFLHGAATQHRELQASPSPAFLALFPRRLTIRRGGVASGFRHVDKTTAEERASVSTPPVLLRIFKSGAGGSNGIVVYEVEPTWQSLDDGDVFVLDSGNTAAGGDRALYIWQGRSCSPMEKAKAAEVAQSLLTPVHKGGVQVLAQAEGRSRVVVRLLGGGGPDGGSDGLGSSTAFQCPRPSGINSGAAAKAGARSTPPPPSQRLWRLSDASGSLSFDLVKEATAGSIRLADLDSDDVLLLDDAGRQVWVWEGRGASSAERAQWLRVAQAYVRRLVQERSDKDGQDGQDDESNGKLAKSQLAIPIAKVHEGYESPSFLRLFQTAAA